MGEKKIAKELIMVNFGGGENHLKPFFEEKKIFNQFCDFFGLPHICPGCVMVVKTAEISLKDTLYYIVSMQNLILQLRIPVYLVCSNELWKSMGEKEHALFKGNIQAFDMNELQTALLKLAND